MKKIFALLLAVLMVFSLAACKNEEPKETQPPVQNNTEPTETEPPTQGPQTVQTDLVLTVNNANMSVTIEKALLEKVTYQQYACPEDADASKYTATLNTVTVDIYNPANETGEHVVVKFKSDYNLLSTDALVLETEYNTESFDEVMEALPVDVVYKLKQMGCEEYKVKVKGSYVCGEGENQVGDTFEFYSPLKVEDKTDLATMMRGTAKLTNEGATITFKYADLLKYMGLNPEEPRNNEKLLIEGFDVFTSLEDMTVTGADEVEILMNADTPSDITLSTVYENAIEENILLYTEYTENECLGYAWVGVNYTAGDETVFYNFYVVVDIVKEYTDPADTPVEPTEPTQETTGPVEQDPTTGEHEDTTGGDE